MLETPPRRVDIPQIVYSVRKGRANAIRSKDQYEFIYSIANSYAMKLNAAPTEG
jgi:protein tyrosine phosphatase